jgi:hypothetical protein
MNFKTLVKYYSNGGRRYAALPGPTLDQIPLYQSPQANSYNSLSKDALTFS